MAMINKLNIERFRGIRELSIDSLNQVNLIVGDNNCGKTSVLEALQLLRTSGSLANIYKIARQRESMFGLNSNSIYENFICMFPKDEKEMRLKISGICNGTPIAYSLEGRQSKILMEAGDLDLISRRQNEDLNGEFETDVFDGIIRYIFAGTDFSEEIHVNRFSKISGTQLSKKENIRIVYVAPFEHLRGNTISMIVKNDGYKEICLKALQLFDSDIEDMMIFRSDVGNRPVEYLKHKKLGNMPLSTFGDGIKKVLVLSNAIAKAAGGILLIDEIETAIHKKYYDEIFRFVVKVCKAFQVQMFITTHSLEAIDGLLETQDYAVQFSDDLIKVVTLKRGQDNFTYSRVLSGREVAENREAFGFEVRL